MTVKSYHTDNGVFKSAEFEEAVSERGQDIQFSGSGAYFQNGVAERSIKMIVGKAHTMMLHAVLHWPDAFEMDLWPWVMHYAAHLYNHTPTEKDGVSPLEVICNIRINCKHI